MSYLIYGSVHVGVTKVRFHQTLHLKQGTWGQHWKLNSVTHVFDYSTHNIIL